MDASTEHQHDASHVQWFRSKTSWALIGFSAVAVFFLLTEHRAHLLGFLPYLIVLACPLIHMLSFLLIGGGFLLLARAWPVLYEAQRAGRLAVDGPYARIRHPQYVAFILVLLGFLFQWPTLLTLAMFPVLILMSVRLAHNEEADSEHKFAQAWRDYAAKTPRFIPKMGVPGQMRPG